jgi:uncharacterized membrane protein
MMLTLLLRIVAGAVSFMVLDGIWLGLVMTGFYKKQLAPIARMVNGGFAPNWPAALVVYDFTNFSTLRQYPFVLTLVDVAWGVAATALASAAVRLVAR